MWVKNSSRYASPVMVKGIETFCYEEGGIVTIDHNKTEVWTITPAIDVQLFKNGYKGGLLIEWVKS